MNCGPSQVNVIPHLYDTFDITHCHKADIQSEAPQDQRRNIEGKYLSVISNLYHPNKR